MAEEQGLSGENVRLIRALGYLPRTFAAVLDTYPGTLNRLLNAARSEGPLPVGGDGGSIEDLCGSGAQERPSLASAGVAETPSGGWQDIASAPKDGTPIRVQTYEVFRWLAYKPDGARQMKRAGRWQKHDGFGFTNCPDPHGVWQPADAGSPTDCQTSGGEE